MCARRPWRTGSHATQRSPFLRDVLAEGKRLAKEHEAKITPHAAKLPGSHLNFGLGLVQLE